MTAKQLVRSGARAAASAVAAGAAAYGAYAAVTWLRYGRATPPDAAEADALLDALCRATTSLRFRSETRAVATDADARARFRNYWAFVSPGVSLIRRLSSGPMKREAERRAACA